MRVIIIEDTVYRISEREFEKIIEVQEEAGRLPFGAELHIDEYLHSNKSRFKELGPIDFDDSSYLKDF